MTPPTSEFAADTAVPLDALLGDAALGPVRASRPTARRPGSRRAPPYGPRTTTRRLGSLAAELGRIAVCASLVTPSRRERVFADPAWSGGPLLHRLAQSYLAAGRTAEQLVEDAELDCRDQQRARFLLEIVGGLAPSNLPPINPASAKDGIDTGGVSLLRDGSQFVRDLRSAPRIPRMVDGSAFGVGRTVAATPGMVVLRTEQFKLIQYQPQTETVRSLPLVIVPPTINKFYALDLAPGRSLVEHLVQSGSAGVRHVMAQSGRSARPAGAWTPTPAPS